jgi:hypothetical protein
MNLLEQASGPMPLLLWQPAVVIAAISTVMFAPALAYIKKTVTVLYFALFLSASPADPALASCGSASEFFVVLQ